MPNTRRARIISSLMLGTASAWLANPVSAQSVQSAPIGSPPAEVTSDRQDIVVTARRREESLRDVPLAITALTGVQLGQAHAKDLRDIAQLTPGLTVVNPTQAYSAFYSIRITDFVFETLPLYNDKRTAGLSLSFRY